MELNKRQRQRSRVKVRGAECLFTLYMCLISLRLLQSVSARSDVSR